MLSKELYNFRIFKLSVMSFAPIAFLDCGFTEPWREKGMKGARVGKKLRVCHCVPTFLPYGLEANILY